jgi:hypothetical protein
MKRITEKDLQAAIDRLNRLTGMPSTPYAKVGDRFEPQAGCYLLECAYGGYQLGRMSLTPGCSGQSTPIGGGFCTKRELYEKLHAYIAGIESEKFKGE